MKVSVIGLEHIGRASAASLVRLGHALTGVDLRFSEGERSDAQAAPKRNLQGLIDATAAEGGFQTTVDLQSAVLNTDISLVCASASSNANGSQDLRALDRVFIQIGTALAKKREYHVIVVRSTVLPGTVEGRFTLLLEQHSGRQAGTDFGICMHPAFSWDTTSTEDMGRAARIVIGELDSRSGDTVQQLYKNADVPIIRTTIQTAEMLNYVSSAFRAVKITFANEIGNLCASHGIDGQEVIEYFCLDRELNISTAYLKPGFAFGGPRLPQDLRALLHRAREQDVDCPLLNAILPSNQRQISRAIELVEKTHRSKIAILGIGFKGGLEGIRENPIIHLAQRLVGKGYRVRIFDETADLFSLTNGFAQDYGCSNLRGLFAPSLQELLRDSEVVVLASNHSVVRNIPELLSDTQILIDLAGVARESTSRPATNHATF